MVSNCDQEQRQFEVSNDLAPASSHNPRDPLKQVERFANLRVAGVRLSEELRRTRSFEDFIVLAIALGGVPVGHELAMRLGLPFDLVLIRRLLVPDGPGSEQCAVNVAGTLIVDNDIDVRETPLTPLDHFLTDALLGFRQREQICRGGKPAMNLAGQNVLLVDCGIHTGSTMKTAVTALRKLKPRTIVGAAPIISREGHAAVAPLFDELIYLGMPDQFINTGYWFRDFTRPADEQIGDLLD